MGVIEYLLDGTQPFVQLALILAAAAFLILPMCGESLFGNVVHTFTANLDFDPLPVIAHEGDVQGLIAVGFRVAHPVAQAVGMRFVYFGYGYVYIEAVIQLFFHVTGLEDDTYGKQVVDFLERHMLCLHLVPNGIDGFDAGKDTVFQSHFIQLGTYRSGELFENLVAFYGCRFKFLFYLAVFFRMLVTEAQVFQFRLYLVQPQPVGKRCIDIQCFTGYLELLVGQHGTECAHIVQPVGYLYEDNADVVGHGKQQFLEVLCLRRGAVAEDAARNFGQSVNDLGDFGAEDVFDILDGVIGVFHHIVQQGGADGSRPQPYLIAHNLRYGDGVHDIRFARAAFDSLMCLIGKIECLGYYFDTLAVFGCQVIVQQFLECLFNHCFFGSLFLLLAYALFHILFLLSSSLFAKISNFQHRTSIYVFICKSSASFPH